MPRFFAVVITLFWLVMTALLLRLEIHPERSRLLDVPVSHVIRLMLAREQQSLLTIKENGAPCGTLMIQPGSSPAGGAFEISGSMSIRLPMWNGQRISWSGGVELDPALATRGFHVSFLLRNPAYRFALENRTSDRAVRYEVRDGERLLTRGSVSLDNPKAPPEMEALGLDANAVIAFRKSFGGGAAPVFTAKQTELPVHGEQIEVFQITMRQGETTLGDAFVSQLGQVLLVKTALGYTLSAEGLP